jgi:hypothetical protein
MTGIRPVERSDLEEVAQVYELAFRSGSGPPPPGLAEYFERMVFDDPWADPEIPSLVYVDGTGAIVGFLGSTVRRLDYDGEPIRMAVSGQLVSHPDARHRAPGAFLMKAYLSGPQDLTITDGATEGVERMWTGLGGDPRQLACVGWIRPLRPWLAASELAAGRKPGLARIARPVAPAFDAVTRTVSSWLSVPRPPGTTEELTPELLVEHLPRVARESKLRPAYDLEVARWLLREVEAVTSRGALVRRLVRTEAGDVAGWFVYYAKKRDIGFVLQVVAPARSVTLVLDHLLHDAANRDVAALRGRLEGELREALWARDCYVRRANALALVHSTRTDLLYEVHSGRALLTRLEGEWWMGHHLYPFP